jgi:multidrug efflux pump subunit AcrA (membrane-fusion protein)
MNTRFAQRFSQWRSFSGRQRWLSLLILLVVVGLGLAVGVPAFRQMSRSSDADDKHLLAQADHKAETPHEHDAHKESEAKKETHDKHEGEKETHTEHEKDAHDGPEAHDEHEGEHAHEKKYDHEHNEASAIKLSEQARGNIGLRLTKVALRPFERTITVPGIVVERPGWTILEITAPMTGVVTRIYPIQGEAVQPGQPLFDIRLTHEDLLQLQTDFLRTTEELDVIDREVARLEKVTAEGVIAGKTLLERKYERQKQEAVRRVQRQALLLHGLSKEQIDGIAQTRTLLQSMTIRAPMREPAKESHPLQVQQLRAVQGKHVNTGDTLCTLADYQDLYIEGQAFEQDVPAITRAVAADAKVSAILGSKGTADEENMQNLRILFLDDRVGGESRAFRFYVALPNHLLRETKAPDGRRFAYWQFKPGQRTQVRVPVEQWKDCIALPIAAVADDGAETYVFEFNDDHFDRRSVRVEYRDQDWVVIANNGVLKVGSMVAASAAHQVQLAIKNKSGGGVDPHAGHNH